MGNGELRASGALPKPGDTLDGKYSLIRVLGEGGMGVVFEAEHLRLKQRCAIKLLTPAMLDQPEIVRRFEREARASAQLRSPHVTRVTDVETTPEGLPYIVMELLVGHDLDVEIQRRGSLPFEEAVDYLLQACAAVDEAHARGIIHRDLKPANLFLAKQDEGVVLKVLDFGISKIVGDDTKLTSAGATMGTALYMSPEQLRSASKVDARSDIWSLGVILYELVSGEPPFTGVAMQVAVAIASEDAPDIAGRCTLPEPLALAIRKMLRRDPAERFASVADVATAIAPYAVEGSLGRAVAMQLSRRASSHQIVVDDRTSDPKLPRGVDAEGVTVAREVTNVAVSTGVSHEPATRRPLVLALLAGFFVAALGLAIFSFFVLRTKDPSTDPTVTQGAAPTTSPVASAVASEAPLTPPTASQATTEVAPTAPSATVAVKPASTTVGATVGGRPPSPSAARPTPAHSATAGPKPAGSGAGTRSTGKPPAGTYNPPFLQ